MEKTKPYYPGWLESHPLLNSLDGIVKIVHRYIHQSTTPDDPNLLVKLGILQSDKLFFYAGYHGDWAYALGKLGCNVTYSDLSSGLVEIMKEDPRSKHFSQIMAVDGSSYPNQSSLYDWSVSFEPAPMVFHNKFYDALIRALLNKKGGKIITRDSKSQIYHKDIMRLVEDYQLELEVSPQFILSKTKLGFNTVPITHKIYTITTIINQIKFCLISKLLQKLNQFISLLKIHKFFFCH